MQTAFCGNCGEQTDGVSAFCPGCGTSVSNTQSVNRSVSINVHSPSLIYGGFWRRGIALFIDGLIIAPVHLLLWLLFMSLIADNPRNFLAYLIGYSILSAMVNPFYFASSHSSSGQTLGKKAMGVKVLGEDEQLISFGRAFVRELLAKPISGIILGLGFMWAGWDPRKQAWHDKLCGTVVKRKNPLVLSASGELSVLSSESVRRQAPNKVISNPTSEPVAKKSDTQTLRTPEPFMNTPVKKTEPVLSASIQEHVAPQHVNRGRVSNLSSPPTSQASMPYMAPTQVVLGYLNADLGNGKKHSFIISSESVFVGRDRTNTIVIPDNTVSKRHFEIKMQGNKWYLANYSSTNPVKLNKRKVMGYCELSSGSVLQAGRVIFQFIIN